jgi:hypothetical protein
VGAIGEQRVPEGPERLLRLRRYGLRRPVQRRRARPLAGDGEVPHADPEPERRDPRPAPGAARAGEVEIEERERPLAADVVVGPERRDRGAPHRGGPGHRRGQSRSRASKIRFAPGISSGVGVA